MMRSGWGWPVYLTLVVWNEDDDEGDVYFFLPLAVIFTISAIHPNTQTLISSSPNTCIPPHTHPHLFLLLTLWINEKTIKILYFNSRKTKNEFWKILTHSGRMLPFGNIELLDTKALFYSEKYIFAISVIGQ